MPISLRSVSFATLRQHRWFRPAVRALAGVIALWFVTWLALPPLVKGPLERIASEQLGRTVTVGGIDFEPWSLEFALRDVAVAGANGSPPQLTIGRVYADGELQSLLRLAPVVDAFTIENPVLRITHLGDGRYDVDDIIAKVTAPQSEPEPDTGPARLALYNLALTGGSIDFIDNAVRETHEVRALALQVPFISTLPSQREVKVEPHLAFTLDGSRFDSSVQSTPFAQTGHADAQIQLQGLNLAPYLGYLPANLPVKVLGATLDADVKVAFEQHPRMAVKLTGTVQASGVRIADRQGADLLSYERLKIDMADVRPLEQIVRLQHVELTAPAVTATRDANGQLNLAQLAAPAPQPAAAQGTTTAPAAPAAAAEPASSPAAGASAASATASPASTGKAKAKTAAPAWAVEVASVAVRGGTLRWADATTRPAAALQATDITLDAADVALPFAKDNAKPFSFKGGLNLQGSTLSFTGEATDQKAQVNATVNALALQLAAPYLAQTLEPTVTGQLSGDVGVAWQAPTPQAAQAGATGVTLKAGPLALEQLIVKQGKTTLASLGKLDIAGAVVPLDARSATLDRLAISQPQLAVERGADGRWMFERWLKAAPAAQGSATTDPAPASNAAPWKLRVADFSVQGGTVSLADNAQPRPVALDVTALGITARNLASDGSKLEAFTLTARAAAPGKGSKAAPGKLDYQGTLALKPLTTQGKLDATRLPLHALDGYLASQLSVELLRADVGYRGQVALAQTDKGVSLRLSGDAVVEDLQANSTAAFTPKTEAQVGEELLAWKSLNLRGLAVATAPGTAPRVEVKETSLVDFFARVTINEAGRINLSDIAKTPAEARAANAASVAASTAAPTASAPASAASATPTAPATAAVAQADPLAPVVAFGPVSLVNGRVAFSDFFIKPNYSADLSDLTGKLSAFSSEASGGEPMLADLELRGRAEGSASLEVTGKLNPLAKPLALDIVGKVRDLELPPLTPYSVKYAGHGIERGKLSVDVNYKVLPNGQLTASNRLVLNQLTFGEPVEGAPNSLPVKLAVALLADRQGVIDLDLPISGSLNDPQFRIGPVIFKVIVNLIGKALTSPFSLLASALGGGEEMSHVPFAPGSATLTPEAQQNLDKVAKALADRPALKITVTGTASLQEEREGLQRESLQQRVLAEKRRANPGDTAPVSAAEYPALLKDVYRRADMPKPRNLVGLAKDLTVPEMETLLLAHQPATEAMAAELATQRSQAIRAYLVAQKLPVERLFVAAPKAGKQAEKWTPRADLSLATQ
ncbi:hypothetical protein KYG_08805 [Acidovorax sp. NO-1]|uniref:DUF748 domain-containing protein n=1 Tax=Acidovorax sp. NO-1 TaxID=512030 RepID=UPI00023FD22B|nr:DUF748 domain-containing protein [Acidovorax sp. NO-1]EHL23337.1 hypothetical protein KYG_08805 [Acidovorax sp. NO-1]